MSVSVPDVVANPDGSPAWVRDPRANALTPVSSDLWAALKKFLPDLDADDPYLYQCADPVISDRLIARAGSNPNQPPVSHRVHKQYLETWARSVSYTHLTLPTILRV